MYTNERPVQSSGFTPHDFFTSIERNQNIWRKVCFEHKFRQLIKEINVIIDLDFLNIYKIRRAF